MLVTNAVLCCKSSFSFWTVRALLPAWQRIAILSKYISLDRRFCSHMDFFCYSTQDNQIFNLCSFASVRCSKVSVFTIEYVVWFAYKIVLPSPSLSLSAFQCQSIFNQSLGALPVISQHPFGVQSDFQFTMFSLGLSLGQDLNLRSSWEARLTEKTRMIFFFREWVKQNIMPNVAQLCRWI